MAVTGSFVSHLMCWRDLDVMLLVGADYRPRDVLKLISRLMELPGVVGFDYRDERAHCSPTGRSETSGITSHSCLSERLVRGGSTSRCGCTIFTETSRRGMRHCVTRSPTDNVRLCCGSRTCGFACRATPDRI